MGVARPLLGFVALFLLAGGLLLEWFLVLSGGVHRGVENRFYFLEADTNGIPNARNPSRWTFWSICGVSDNGHNSNCGSPVAALPFNPPQNFFTQTNIPSGFQGTHHYYYLSRFMFAFYLISFFFANIALFTGLLALCSRLGGYISFLTTFVALFFHLIAAALQTAWTVQGRNTWRSAGFASHVGTKLMAFTWTTFVCYLLASILFCIGGTIGRDKSKPSRTRSTRSTRSRGSFLDSESQRRVNKEYN